MMDFHAEMILEDYRNNLETFEIIKKVVLEQLNGYVKSFGSIVNSVEARIKTEKSLAGKLALKGDKYQDIFDITDLVGARVVTFYNDEVDKFAAQVEKSFDIDWDNSIDKRKMYNVDQFGYMSLHYICHTYLRFQLKLQQCFLLCCLLCYPHYTHFLYHILMHNKYSRRVLLLPFL